MEAEVEMMDATAAKEAEGDTGRAKRRRITGPESAATNESTHSLIVYMDKRREWGREYDESAAAIKMFAIDLGGRGGKSSPSMYELGGGAFDLIKKLGKEIRCMSIASRLYIFGGADDPRDVLFCKMHRDDGGRISCGDLQFGPRLQAPKPNPLLVTVNGKLYALAGFVCEELSTNGERRTSFEHTGPVFEVLSLEEDHQPGGNGGNRKEGHDDDDKKRKWYPLDNPPFMCLYKGDSFLPCSGPDVVCYTVFEATIYMHVTNPKDDTDMHLYSFNTVLNKWQTHGLFIDSPWLLRPSYLDHMYESQGNFVANLRICCWGARLHCADTVGNKLFACSLNRLFPPAVYAYDLSIKKDGVLSSDEYDNVKEDDGFYLVLHPVDGLTEMIGSVPKPHRFADSFLTHGTITHLVGNKFCLLGIFSDFKSRMMCMRVCTFDIREDLHEDMDMVTENKESPQAQPAIETNAAAFWQRMLLGKILILGMM